MAREKYSARLKCPVCHRTGQAEMSDAKSYKIEASYDTRVDVVSDGFQIVGATSVICAEHKVSALME